jgi:FAD:protein FMN transferase
MYKCISFFIVFILFCLTSCKDKKAEYNKLSGPTMGTTYHITVQTTSPEGVKNGIDSILADFNLSMSAYIDTSTLSFLNAAEKEYCFDPKTDPYFEPIFIKSKEVYAATGGAFNPCIAPLVNYYGFGYKEKKKLKETDTLIVKELLKLLVFDSLILTKDSMGQLCMVKPNPKIMLDFNSISPGYAVDVIAAYLDRQNILNYMIELGGEIRARGVNDKEKEWVIGINKPSSSSAVTEIELPLLISNKSLATSGNYRSAYESKGQKFAHIINPFTGLSHPTDILSATVIADDCITADAYATAFMVLGLEKSLLLAKEIKGIDACFIYDIEGDGIFEFGATEGFSKYYLDNEQK